MEERKIVSVRYNKETGEFTIKERNIKTGDLIQSLGNTLPAAGLVFIKSIYKHKYEDEKFLIWA